MTQGGDGARRSHSGRGARLGPSKNGGAVPWRRPQSASAVLYYYIICYIVVFYIIILYYVLLLFFFFLLLLLLPNLGAVPRMGGLALELSPLASLGASAPPRANPPRKKLLANAFNK